MTETAVEIENAIIRLKHTPYDVSMYESTDITTKDIKILLPTIDRINWTNPYSFKVSGPFLFITKYEG